GQHHRKDQTFCPSPRQLGQCIADRRRLIGRISQHATHFPQCLEARSIRLHDQNSRRPGTNRRRQLWFWGGHRLLFFALDLWPIDTLQDIFIQQHIRCPFRLLRNAWISSKLKLFEMRIGACDPHWAIGRCRFTSLITWSNTAMLLGTTSATASPRVRAIASCELRAVTTITAALSERCALCAIFKKVIPSIPGIITSSK